MDLVVRTTALDGLIIVGISGVLDIWTADVLRQELAALFEAGHADLIADLSGVAFLDSTGLGVLVAAERVATRRGGRLELVVAGERVRRVFRISGLSQQFVIHDTLEQALASR